MPTLKPDHDTAQFLADALNFARGLLILSTSRMTGADTALFTKYFYDLHKRYLLQDIKLTIRQVVRFTSAIDQIASGAKGQYTRDLASKLLADDQG